MQHLKLAQTFTKLRQLPALCIRLQQRFMAKNVASADTGVKDEPIQYFGSQASVWRAKDTRSGGADEHLWYQPYVISASIAVFMLYFCVLREESDIDRKLEGTLYDQVEGFEEMQLTMNYKYNKEHGMDNREVVKRLGELGIDVNLLDSKLAAEK